MNLRTLALGMTVVLSLMACPGPSGGDGGQGGGTGTGGGSGGGSGGVPLDQLCTQLASTDCDYFVRCGGFEAKTNCLNLFNILLDNGGCAGPQFVGIDAGHITYDPQAAASCLAGFTSATCQGFGVSSPAACDQVFVGNIAVGAPCGFEGECVPGAFCATGAASCGGTCTQLIAIGHAAGAGDQCVKGAQPVGGVCTAELAPGSNCAAPDGGFDFLPCASPSSCYPDFLDDGGISAICSRTAAVGMPCDDADAGIHGCGGFSYCDSTTHLCVKTAGLDGGCDPLAYFTCKLDLWCDSSQTSPVCRPQSALGGPCVEATSCLNGVCDGGSPGSPGTLGACVGLPGLNDGCSGSCATGLFCDYSSSTCKTLKADGQTCSAASECVTHACNTVGDAGTGRCGLCP
jgi:hypothetical protein